MKDIYYINMHGSLKACNQQPTIVWVVLVFKRMNIASNQKTYILHFSLHNVCKLTI